MKAKQFVWLAPLGAFTLGIAVTLMVDSLAVQTDQAVTVLLSLVVGLLGVSFGLVGLTAVILQNTSGPSAFSERYLETKGDSETADRRASGERPPMFGRVRRSPHRPEPDSGPPGAADRTGSYAARGHDSGTPSHGSNGRVERGMEPPNISGSRVQAHDADPWGMEEDGSRDRSRSLAEDGAGGSNGETSRGGSTWPPSGAERKPRDPETASVGMQSTAPTLDPGGLIEAWDRYLTQGDGHFDASGLQEQLEAVGVEGGVVAGQELGVGDVVLGVYGPGDHQRLYLVPNFGYSPGAVAEWFVDEGSGGRNAMIQRLNQVAVVRRIGQGIELVQQGAVA